MSRRRKLPLTSRATPDYRIVDTSINYRRIEEIRSLYFIPESYSIRVPNKDEMVKQSEINKNQAISEEKKKKELEKASGAASHKRPSVKGLTKQQKKAKATPDDTPSKASADASKTSKDDGSTELYETMARKCHREPVDQTPTERGPSASLSEQEVDSELQFSTPPTSTTTLLDQGMMKEKEEEVKEEEEEEEEDDLHILEHWPGTKICTDPNDKLCLFTVFARSEGKDKVLDNDAPAPANPKPALETSKLMQSPIAAASSVPSAPKMAPARVAQLPSIPTVYSSSLTELKAMLSQLVLPFTPHRLREIREQFVAMDRENISTICHTRKTFLLVLARELASMKLPEALAKDYAPWPKQLESILQTCTENLPVVETTYHPQEDDAQEELRKVTDRIDLCASRASDYAVSERQIMSRLEPAKAEVERLQAELSRAQAVLAQVEADLGQLEVDRANHAEEEPALRDVAAQTIKALMKAKRADKLHDIEYSRARNTLDAAAEQLRQFVDQFRRDFLGLTSSSNGIQATPSPVTPSVTRPAEDATPKPSEGDNA